MGPGSTSPSIRACPLVGSVLNNKWRIDALLGTGGMASVFRATHRNGHRVAVKVLHAELSYDAEIRRRFLLEGYAANAIDHPAVVRVLDDDVTDDGAAFLVMDLLEGETLCGRCERLEHGMPASEVVAIAETVLDLLTAAHARGIVHRDIKPDNVFLTSEGAVKVLDFGIAQIRTSPGSFATQAGATFGTPAFMSPEQALGRSHEVDGRSDVWSVGATIFWALSGRSVHEGDTINEVLVRAATRAASRLASVVPDVPPDLAAVVDRALEMDRAVRWQNAGAMRDALHQAKLDAPPRAAAPAPKGFGAPAPDAPTMASDRAVTLDASATASLRGRRRSVVATVAGVGSALLLGLCAVALHARGAPSRAAAAVATPQPPSERPAAAIALPQAVVTATQAIALPESGRPPSPPPPSFAALRPAKAPGAARSSVPAPSASASQAASNWLDQR